MLIKTTEYQKVLPLAGNIEPGKISWKFVSLIRYFGYCRIYGLWFLPAETTNRT